MLKDVTRFPAHCGDEDTFLTMMEEAQRHGIKRPSSYSDCFHSAFHSPRIKHSLNALFAGQFTGGWEEAKATGVLPGKWYQYDMQSAYLWSGSQGLPDASTFRYADSLSVPNGMFVIDQAAPRVDLPYPFNVRRIVNATRDEIDAYGLNVHRIVSGVSWTKTISGEQVEEAVKRFTFWKEVGKTYWGRWCSTQPLKCHSRSGAHWGIRNPVLNLVWAHVVISRVKLRVWESAKDAAHVFVDSVIVPRKLDVGTRAGDWRLEDEFSEGVHIRHAGYFGPAGGEWKRTSGTKRSA